MKVIVMKFILILSNLFFISCYTDTKKSEYTWEAAISRPANYVSNGQHVFYFNNGKMISGTETLTDIGDFGWNFPQAARNNGDMTILPDSVSVYYCGLNNKNQMHIYKGGISLPVNKMEKIIKKDTLNNFYITTGMAPGGRICIWLNNIEIKRGVVKEYEKFSDYPAIVSSGDSLKINTYLKNHPIDYSFWEKPDPSYELDFGFCSENNKEYNFSAEFYSKEGIRNFILGYYLDLSRWNEPCNQAIEYEGEKYFQHNEKFNKNKIQLPVHFSITWENVSKNKYYITELILPKEFPKRFTKSYINPKTGKKCNYHRLVFGIEKDGEHCIIWLDGPEKQEKLMRFKGHKTSKSVDSLTTPNYASEITYY